ncbi:DUF1127 domain-containing protein [Siccirubricoccus sp. KC 17139]|uniref:DUF1127 domain-containing protein n=1 Tax=Siccirubricoccus soli TaxID=2899147 RepID=A0ABT1DDD7_9PROT|nr:DUF1127 domain-containing protein [Siccirubricoccus soli]MCO6419952.1 DUF1127 domain-containing protein [Siccirubricoccus soli]MCP2686087.1 DUF1127 domain-containing protein [Siccirubricoccus soli]
MGILPALRLHLPAFTFSLPRITPFRAMWRAIATRRQLAEMDDRMLRDIGISRADALHEAERAPWDLGRRI